MNLSNDKARIGGIVHVGRARAGKGLAAREQRGVILSFPLGYFSFHSVRAPRAFNGGNGIARGFCLVEKVLLKILRVSAALLPARASTNCIRAWTVSKRDEFKELINFELKNGNSWKVFKGIGLF